MELSQKDKEIINRVRGELISGIGLEKMEVPPAYSNSDVELLVEKINGAPHTLEVQLNCTEIKLLRNMCCDLLRELDDFEFHPRMGYTPDEVFEVYKKVKKSVDTICY